jgi:cell division protein FtsB
MAFFKKKSDPISDRARALNAEIAALESKIKQLSAQEKAAPPPVANHHQPPPPPSPAAPAPQPRLRSTTVPHHRHGGASVAQTAPAHEPVFENLNRAPTARTAPPAQPRDDLGVRKNDLSSFWQRLKTHFRGPPASNPKLVNYLAAGSIQGLRPLRYERRVARNRFIFFVILLVLLLWGVVAFFLKHR